MSYYEKKIIISLILALIVVLFFIPVIFTEEFGIEEIKVGVSLVGALSGISSLIIAILLFNKVGIGGKILDKRLENVVGILEGLRALSFFIEVKAEGRGTMWQQTIYDYMKYTKRTAFADNKDAILLFDFENYWTEIESIDKLRKNPWTPIEIAEKLDFLHFITFETDTNKIQKMPAIAKVVLNRSKAFIEKEKRWGMPQKLQDDLQILLGDYFSDMEATIKYIEKWLNKYSEHKINLNF